MPVIWDMREGCRRPSASSGERSVSPCASRRMVSVRLAMVYGVVQRHSADLEIESTPGKGTTVRLSFAAPAGVATDVTLPETGICSFLALAHSGCG